MGTVPIYKGGGLSPYTHDSDGNVQKVWPVVPSEGKKGCFSAAVRELSNGHLMGANWAGYGAADSKRGWQLIEFDETGKGVWTLYDS